MNWDKVYESLNCKGYAFIQGVLSRAECEHLRGFYDDDMLFRNVVAMERYRFGKGEYKYFNYPLPPSIQVLRESIYKPLSKLANEWMQKLGMATRYPEDHNQLLEWCRTKNQHRPTPLILRYQPGGYNTLHQDLYGAIYFPFQVLFVLTQPGIEHEGGDFVLTEQIPRAQSKAEVIRPNQGDAVIFTTNFRPIGGKHGFYKARVKHGVSEVTRGNRFALGIIFHDAT